MLIRIQRSNRTKLGIGPHTTVLRSYGLEGNEPAVTVGPSSIIGLHPSFVGPEITPLGTGPLPTRHLMGLWICLMLALVLHVVGLMFLLDWVLGRIQVHEPKVQNVTEVVHEEPTIEASKNHLSEPAHKAPLDDGFVPVKRKRNRKKKPKGEALKTMQVDGPNDLTTVERLDLGLGNSPTQDTWFSSSYTDQDGANLKVEETAPGVATGMILSLRESLQSCKDALATCQSELEDAKAEVQKWHSAFQKESFIPLGSSVEPRVVINYLQNLKSSEESIREQLEKAKKKEAAFIVTIAKREQEIADLKAAVRDLRSQLKPLSMQARRLLLDPAIHEEFMRLKNLVEEKDKKVKELQDNVAAVNFTPQSKMGKMLMAKCRTLQEENEEIGNQAKEGKIHELSMKLASQKAQNVELRSHFEGLSKHMEVLTNDVEKSNEMVLILEESLSDKEVEIQRLRLQLQQYDTLEEKTETLAADKNDTHDDVTVSVHPEPEIENEKS
ncbi:hypothetical protein L1987_53609 [Smallanthus sonchifolius]|uniref:Uncharacterized protein n=1 Tax=Smallanthus sonchifolius TaxID=185202 RepID=A0ACB9EX53_9ASTR|nr:hypothetical protein L1987_53609 [Smallanthus sonchifolius]